MRRVFLLAGLLLPACGAPDEDDRTPPAAEGEGEGAREGEGEGEGGAEGEGEGASEGEGEGPREGEGEGEAPPREVAAVLSPGGLWLDLPGGGWLSIPAEAVEEDVDLRVRLAEARLPGRPLGPQWELSPAIDLARHAEVGLRGEAALGEDTADRLRFALTREVAGWAVASARVTGRGLATRVVHLGGRFGFVIQDLCDDVECMDDGNPCTSDVCLLGVCGDALPDGTVCSESSACVLEAECVSGVCQGEPVDCDDGRTCSVDVCVPAVGCQHHTRGFTDEVVPRDGLLTRSGGIAVHPWFGHVLVAKTTGGAWYAPTDVLIRYDLWGNEQDWTHVPRFPEHGTPMRVNSLLLLPDGGLLGAGGFDAGWEKKMWRWEPPFYDGAGSEWRDLGDVAPDDSGYVRDLAYHEGWVYASMLSGDIRRFDVDDPETTEVFVAAGTGGLAMPWGIAIDPASASLYAAERETGEIRRFDLATGDSLGDVVDLSPGIDDQTPLDLEMGPEGLLYVVGEHKFTHHGYVDRYAVPSGDFAGRATYGGGPLLYYPGQMAFDAQGRLYVTRGRIPSPIGNGAVHRYEGAMVPCETGDGVCTGPAYCSNLAWEECLPATSLDERACDDGDACTAGTTCSGGECAGGQQALCLFDDLGPCEAPACDAALGCIRVDVEDDAPCGDGLVCEDGECVEDEPPEPEGDPVLCAAMENDDGGVACYDEAGALLWHWLVSDDAAPVTVGSAGGATTLDGFVYIAGGDAIFRVDPGAGTLHVWPTSYDVTANNVNCLATYDGQLVAVGAAGGWAHRIDAAGNTVVPPLLVDAQNPQGFVQAPDGTAYAADVAKLYRITPDGQGGFDQEVIHTMADVEADFFSEGTLTWHAGWLLYTDHGADFGLGHVVRVDPDTGEGTVVAEVTDNPRGLAIDPTGEYLYVGRLTARSVDRLPLADLLSGPAVQPFLVDRPELPGVFGLSWVVAPAAP